VSIASRNDVIVPEAFHLKLVKEMVRMSEFLPFINLPLANIYLTMTMCFQL